MFQSWHWKEFFLVWPVILSSTIWIHRNWSCSLPMAFWFLSWHLVIDPSKICYQSAMLLLHGNALSLLLIAWCSLEIEGTLLLGAYKFWMLHLIWFWLLPFNFFMQYTGWISSYNIHFMASYAAVSCYCNEGWYTASLEDTRDC